MSGIAAPQFPETERETLAAAMRSGGLTAAQDFIAVFDTAREQSQLYRLLTRIASKELRPRFPFDPAQPVEDWLTLDELAGVYQAAISHNMTHMDTASDSETADWFKAEANVMSFNFMADLAPCWPGDDEPREARHYNAGVAAGRNAVRWRIELNKKPENFALAYWGLGIHQLGLGDPAGAAESFDKAREYSAMAAQEYGRHAQVSPDGDWSYILNHGYRGLARAKGADNSGLEQYRAALAAYRGMAEQHEGELAEDAKFGIAQLEKTAAVFGIG